MSDLIALLNESIKLAGDAGIEELGVKLITIAGIVREENAAIEQRAENRRETRRIMNSLSDALNSKDKQLSQLRETLRPAIEAAREREKQRNNPQDAVNCRYCGRPAARFGKSSDEFTITGCGHPEEDDDGFLTERVCEIEWINGFSNSKNKRDSKEAWDSLMSDSELDKVLLEAGRILGVE